MRDTCGFCGIEYERPDGFDGGHTCKIQDLWDALGTLKETVRQQNIAIADQKRKRDTGSSGDAR